MEQSDPSGSPPRKQFVEPNPKTRKDCSKASHLEAQRLS
jgi:hypothetical protein